MNIFASVRCSKNYVRVYSMFNKMVFDPTLVYWRKPDLHKKKFQISKPLTYATKCIFNGPSEEGDIEMDQ